MIRPIQKRQSLGADIAQQLQEMLINGTYKPGDILPSQRALAEQFGTSLATVREAVSIISAAGLIEAQAGRGTVVCATPDASGFNAWLGAVNQLSDANEFLETRRLLEHYTISQAAINATSTQLAPSSSRWLWPETTLKVLFKPISPCTLRLPKRAATAS
jgi:GntR family transcriptional regulator, transcriptional repressor for pyruvate dehydrogenase complex